jgi:hypothetical protein
MEPQFKKPVQASCSHIGQVECGRARSPDAGHAGQERPEHAEIGVEFPEIPEGKSGSEQGFIEVRTLGDPNPSIVEERAFPPARHEQFAAQGIQDDARFQYPAGLEGDRDRERGKPMEKIRGPVQGIDDPAQPGLGPPTETAFLGQDGMIRIDGTDHFQDGLLGPPVHLAHKIMTGFFLDLEVLDPVHLAEDDLTPPTGGTDGDIGDGLHANPAEYRCSIADRR